MQKYERLLCIVIPVLLILSSCKKDDGDIAVVSTSEVVGVTSFIAICGGNITSDGGAAITERGVCWSTSETPIISDNKSTGGTGTGSFTCNIKGLTGNTTYYIAAYATNSAGTGYGEIKSFTTPPTVTDVDGNTYSTVQIGDQCWMQENLNTTKDASGTPITRYCYNDDLSNCNTYGGLYTWDTTMNGSESSIANPSGVQGICPDGWHIPTKEEYETLEDFVGDQAALLVKEDQPAAYTPTNETGFSALFAGFRHHGSGSFTNMGIDASFWSSTEAGTNYAWHMFIRSNVSIINYVKDSGYSVRCLKD